MDIEKPSDTQLKQALAKMLPDLLTVCTNSGADDLYLELIFKYPCNHRTTAQSPRVLDTELLGLCHLVEETLSPSADKEMECDIPNIWRDYVTRLDADCYNNGGHSCVHATWQQRVLALSEVLGVAV